MNISAILGAEHFFDPGGTACIILNNFWMHERASIRHGGDPSGTQFPVQYFVDNMSYYEQVSDTLRSRMIFS